MRIGASYSHLNGEEFLLARRPELRGEILDVIDSVNASHHLVKQSEEAGKVGKMLFAPKTLNPSFKAAFHQRGWDRRRQDFWVAKDARVLRAALRFSSPEFQRDFIDRSDFESLRTHYETDFYKDRVGVEVQFGKYAFVAHDMFVKHHHFYLNDEIDVGVEIMPMKSMVRQMSSGVAWYEKELFNLIRQGRNSPSVPLWIIGIEP